ncbi:hypothetical protein D3C81_734840 [compost metagenome]
MQEITCPHCLSDVPYGAKVCRGCQAEIEYGMPPAALLFIFLAAILSAMFIGSATHSIVGWIIFFGVLAGGIWGCAKIFKDRINFKRIYRTR